MNSKGNIIIVDDTHDILLLLTAILQDEGYNVSSADSGELALMAMQTRKPDLILLDIQMPGISGFDVCRQLKSNAQTAAIPIIFLTAATNVAERVAGLKLGAVDYILKPFEKEELLARVSVHIHNSILTRKLKEQQDEYERLNEELSVSNEELIATTDALDVLKKEKEHAEELGRNFENIFTNSPVGIFVVDVKERNQYTYNAINPFSEALLGITNLELQGKNLDFIGTKYGTEIRTYVENLYNEIVKSKETKTFEEDIMLGNKLVQVNTSIRPLINKKGNVYRLIGTNLDITQLKQTQTQLIQAKEQAEESNKLKSAFLNNMSHEVRTPLNAIVGFSRLITRPNQSNEKLEIYSKQIAENSEKLIEIITDIIEISQIQTGMVVPAFLEFDFMKLLRGIFEKYSPACKEKEIVFSIENRHKYESLLIETDEDKLNRILHHLLGNAIKFTFHGSVAVVVSIENNNLVIEIKDTGIGIADEMQKIIFEPFRQVESGITRDFGGNGLGLAIVKSYTNLLKGSITLKSEINQGTTFTITIPTNKKLSNTATDKTTNNKAKVKTILIAEDEYSNYVCISSMLEELSMNTLHAKNGQEAVDFCKTNIEMDLVLMDIKMPVMDGADAAKLIKEFRPDLPIIAQTAYALENEKTKYTGVFDDYITKPFTETILFSTLLKYINNE